MKWQNGNTTIVVAKGNQAKKMYQEAKTEMSPKVPTNPETKPAATAKWNLPTFLFGNKQEAPNTEDTSTPSSAKFEGFM